MKNKTEIQKTYETSIRKAISNGKVNEKTEINGSLQKGIDTRRYKI